MNERVRRLVRRSTATLIGLACAALALEICYRTVRAPALSPTTSPSYVRHDPQLGWSHRPGARERHKTPEFDVEVEINARGFRGPAWGAKTPGRPRVLVLGDSFAFGWGVEQAQSFSALLQARRPRWEVLNAAVSGYGTDQQLLLLERLLDEVAPDLVVDVFCANDLFENAGPIAYGKHKPYFVDHAGRLELRGVPVPQSWLERSSYVVRALRKAAWERSFDARRVDPDQDWILTCDLYREMRRVLHGVPLVIVSAEQRLADLAREEASMHHLDLRPVFAAAEGAITYPIDGHWTALAHRKVAQALEQVLGPLLP